MVYSTEAARWKAYEFSDPFAAGSFYVCNKVNKHFCRPDCDARPITNLKSEIKFVDTPADALSLGYIPCESCDAMSAPSIDVSLLFNSVAEINRQIGFLPPLMDVNEEKNNQIIKANIIESKRVNEEQILKTLNNVSGTPNNRRSLPNIHVDSKFAKETTPLSKNDSDHYRLVDLACRHLALAAAMSIFQTPATKSATPEEGNSPESPNSVSKRRRRRGGVLGFKELAAKSKLSAWHFHRVFKSVTGLTPKAYGDKCWEYIKKFKDSGNYTSFASSPDAVPASKTPSMTYQSNYNEPSVPTTPEFGGQPAAKRVKIETPDVISPSSKVSFNINANSAFSQQQSFQLETPVYEPVSQNQTQNQKFAVPQAASFEFNRSLFNNNFNMFENQLTSSNVNRTFSVPDLTKFDRESSTSFLSHTPRIEEQPQAKTQFEIKQEHDSSPTSSNFSPTTQDDNFNINSINLNEGNLFQDLGNNGMDDFSNLMVDLDNAAANPGAVNMPFVDEDYLSINPYNKFDVNYSNGQNGYSTKLLDNFNNDTGLNDILLTVNDL